MPWPIAIRVLHNDLPFSVKTARVAMNADDTSLAFQSENMSQLPEALNDDL